MDRVGDYLRLPTGYAPFLEGLRWSVGGDAVEYADGQTFALGPQIALLLEGLAADRPPVHFAFVLHLLALLGLGEDAPRATEVERAFHETGRPLRNAGALAAVLCRRLPSVAEPPDVGLVCRRLCSPALMAELAQLRALSAGCRRESPDSVPPLTAPAFEAAVLRELAPLAPEDLRHWLRHGRPPLREAGAQLAHALPAGQPRALGHVLAELSQRRRVAGAVPFVAQMVSALALPPRHLAHREQPLGGYADVATRGHPEQILPSQLVLEDPPPVGAESALARAGGLSLEFIRRYAENELLYFRREEPHAQVREELVLLLDQGVRTWGDVRLVLTAAVLAFGKLAQRRQLPLQLGGTSSQGRLLDPLEAEPADLARLLEASDLSANPGLALERVLEELAVPSPDRPATDVVLLTHPRALAEPDVTAAARRVGPAVRLFALAVDQRGTALLAQVKRGTPVRVSQFHVDLARPAEAAPPRPAGPAEPRAAWRGDVEPVGFPFCFGITTPATSHLFDFDQGGEWVLELSHNGVLHAWRGDGSGAEVLPRGCLNGIVFTDVDAVRGVAGGFVVAGRLQGELAAVHYDFGRRVCTAHLLGPAGNGRWQWSYFADLHAVVACDAVRQADHLVYAVDLATGARWRHRPGAGEDPETRLLRAYRRGLAGESISPFVRIVDGAHPAPGPGPCLRLDRGTGTLTLEGTEPAWPPFVPLADGRPVLRGARLLFAKYRGDVLAIDCYDPDRGGLRVLRLFRGPDGTPLGELAQPPRLPGFVALSPDGRRLAREISRTKIEVRELRHGLRPIGSSPRGKCHHGLVLDLGEMWLTLQAGRSTHLVRWDRGPLECSFTIGDRERFVRQQLAGTSLRTTGVRATPAGLPRFVLYDRKRFVQAAHATLVAVVDAFGQVAVFERTGALVAILFVFRGQAAAWLPDGTRHGPAAIIGGPPTPGALERIGAALREAWARNEETQQ